MQPTIFKLDRKIYMNQIIESQNDIISNTQSLLWTSSESVVVSNILQRLICEYIWVVEIPSSVDEPMFVISDGKKIVASEIQTFINSEETALTKLYHIQYNHILNLKELVQIKWVPLSIK